MYFLRVLCMFFFCQIYLKSPKHFFSVGLAQNEKQLCQNFKKVLLSHRTTTREFCTFHFMSSQPENFLYCVYLMSSQSSVSEHNHNNWSRRVHGLFDHYYHRVENTSTAKKEFFNKEIQTRADITLRSVDLNRNIEQESDDELKFIAQALHGLKSTNEDAMSQPFFEVEREVRKTKQQHDCQENNSKIDQDSYFRSVASQMKFKSANDIVTAKAVECQNEIAEMMRLVKLYKENNFEALQRRLIEGKELIDDE